MTDYQILQKKGICPHCKGILDKPKGLCIKCTKKSNEYKKETAAFMKSIGFCPQCGKNKLFGDEKLCLGCRAYFAEKQSKRREKDRQHERDLQKASYKRIANYRNENNLCTMCGKPRVDKYKRCPLCRRKHTIKAREKRALEINKIEYREMNGLCRFCDNKRKEGYKVCEFHHARITEISRSREKVEINRKLKDSGKLF